MGFTILYPATIVIEGDMVACTSKHGAFQQTRLNTSETLALEKLENWQMSHVHFMAVDAYGIRRVYCRIIH